MTVNILLSIIFLLVVMGCTYYLIIKYYEKQINKHIFEIVKPKPKGKKSIYLIMNIQNYVIVSYAKY